PLLHFHSSNSTPKKTRAKKSMEIHRNPLLNWAYFCHGKSMDELRNSLLYTTLELEQTRLAAQEELQRRDEQLIELRELLERAKSEREELSEKCQRLMFENLLIHHQIPPPVHQISPGVSSIEDVEHRLGINNGFSSFSSSDCEESGIVSSQSGETGEEPPFPAPEKPLPEKGKLLEAVMKAGPLLKTLLLAGGPLPQWNHPPPPLGSFEIPPVTIPSPAAAAGNGFCGRKRGFAESGSLCESLTETKYQRVALH
ncbi:hypothetical protein LINGRAHAP2_LOCUS29736, partial [Linum grandiflorum]